MKLMSLTGFLLSFAGTIGLIASALTGRIELVILIIVPIIMMRGLLPFISIVLVIIGLSLIAMSAYRSFSNKRGSGSKGSGKFGSNTTYGGVIFLGPFPIPFGYLSKAVPGYIIVMIILLALIFLMIAIILLVAWKLV